MKLPEIQYQFGIKGKYMIHFLLAYTRIHYKKQYAL